MQENERMDCTTVCVTLAVQAVIHPASSSTQEKQNAIIIKSLDQSCLIQGQIRVAAGLVQRSAGHAAVLKHLPLSLPLSLFVSLLLSLALSLSLSLSLSPPPSFACSWVGIFRSVPKRDGSLRNLMPLLALLGNKHLANVHVMCMQTPRAKACLLDKICLALQNQSSAHCSNVLLQRCLPGTLVAMPVQSIKTRIGHWNAHHHSLCCLHQPSHLTSHLPRPHISVTCISTGL